MGTTGCTDLMMLLHRTGHALETELTARLAEIGLTPRARCVLSTALDADLTQTEIADVISIDKTTMVVTMDALESAGHAERRPSPTDRRARVVVVTEQGRAIVAKADEVYRDVVGSVLGSLPADERSGLVNGLTRLVEGRLSTPVACEKPPRKRALRHAVG
ncbi:MarR family winged helix-turn-helix transcriptional regulator [Lentzea sp. NEAU-D7]|uniref:MarR family winged helix-turn-helix transcriptional regulator n=1 Tax=Lentzea sp. NEAU-D7 TaxID=2994667 RepID=UPI00224A9476|nr:MarR family winged helix-turn-helix transcriptional regulator [Lentzea sp. NEAU-D7]MCX2949529.1 MarR family winged helix-turn-helix transcriptional regulator [Lentzea sp. NEAU-D7]